MRHNTALIGLLTLLISLGWLGMLPGTSQARSQNPQAIEQLTGQNRVAVEPAKGTATLISTVPTAPTAKPTATLRKTATPTTVILGTSTPTQTPTTTNPTSTLVATPTLPPNATASPTPTLIGTPNPTWTATPLPTEGTPPATPTITPTDTPLPLVQSITLPVSDGWDSQFADRLSTLEQLETVTTSDDNRWQIAPNAFTSFEFENLVPDLAKIQSVQVWIEHAEDAGFVAGALSWQVGVGKLKQPTIFHVDAAPLLLGTDNEQAVAWDVTAWIQTPAQVNDLKVLIYNSDLAQSAWLDQVYVIVTYTADTVPPPTATTTPDAYNLQGRVTLEQRPAPPNHQWVMPITVNLRTGVTSGAPSTRGFALTTDSEGIFQLQAIQPGGYQMAVKGTHTLQRVISVTVQDTLTSVDVGLLREGDAVNDNRINILDFSRLAGSYGRCATDTNYLATADFNQDGCINAGDIALLRGNFGQVGEVFSATRANAASLEAIPLGIITNKQSGERFRVMVSYTNLTNTPVDAAAIYLNFDPTYLQALAVTGNPVLSTQLMSQIDNSQGQLIQAAGAVGDGVVGVTTLALITFEARQPIQTTPLILEFSSTHQSAVAYRGQALTTGNSSRAPEFTGVEVIVIPRLFLPVVKVN